MIDHAALKKMNIEELLIKSICQGNGASRQEIMNRQMLIKPMPGLGKFLLDELMKSNGVERAQPIVHDSNDLHEIDITDNPDMICVMARRCIRDGYTGQNMKDASRARTYIKMAAANPRVMDELPESGMAFWKSADFHFRMWKTERDQ